MLATDATKKWISQLLSNDSTVNAKINSQVFQSVGDLKSSFPFVVYDFLTGNDVGGLCREIIQTDFYLQVKMIFNKALSDSDRIATSKMDELIRSTENQVSDGYVFTAKRLQPVDYKEPLQGSDSLFYHIGGVYMVSVHVQ